MKKTGKSFGERVAAIRGTMSRKALGAEIGVSDGAVAKYENGSTMPAVDVAVRIAKFGNVSIEWLLGLSDEPGGLGDLKELPRYDIQASAGDGKLALTEMPDNHVRISEAFIARHVPPGAKLGVIDIVGDSMWPTLLDGDLAIVNVNIDRRQLAGGGVFVFTVGEDVYVKRMILQPDGTLIATSDNPEYPSFTFDTKDDQNGLEVHGKVIIPIGPPRPFGGSGKGK